MKNADVARAFVEGLPKKNGNARTDGQTYWLHNYPIAVKKPDGVIFDWCGWYTQTTARHMNHISKALGLNRWFSAARALKEKS